MKKKFICSTMIRKTRQYACLLFTLLLLFSFLPGESQNLRDNPKGLKVNGFTWELTEDTTCSLQIKLSSGNVTLSYHQNTLSTEYTPSTQTPPQNTNYSYKMEDFKEDWTQITTGPFAGYNNLKPGNYLFKIKKSTIQKPQNKNSLSIKIIILKSLWKTPLPYILGFFLPLLAFVIFYRWQLKHKKKKAEQHTKIKETEQRAKEAEFQVSIAKARTQTIHEESKRKTLELEEERNFLSSMLPKALPELPHLDIAVAMETASEVGGDYYDFKESGDGALFVVCGDATGHGLRAGTMVSVIKTLFVADALGPSDDFNRFFNECSGTIKKVGLKNLNMALTMLKIDDYKVTVSSAGMPPVFIYRKANDMVETVTLKAPPLGGIKTFTYRCDFIRMEPGDTVLLTTDGLPELFNRDNEMFGHQRIQECLKKIGTESPEEILAHLKTNAEKWLNYKSRDDDMTFVVIQFK
ncbi:MAG: SpoIIE family protein phosphatase [bacterium]|nr:SpoIIE family protein phosphatase [bacterium]